LNGCTNNHYAASNKDCLLTTKHVSFHLSVTY
jgi:hypothetical protein